MNNPQVAHRYAKALLDLAKEMASVEGVRADMALVAATSAESRDLRLLFASPIVTPLKKLEVFKALFGATVNKLTTAFVELLGHKGRIDLILAIAGAFEQQYNDLNNVAVATLTTATPIDPTLRAQFMALVAKETGKTATLIEQVNPDVIGGFLLQMDNQQIDSTVKTQLANMRLKLIDNTYISKL